MWTPKDRRWLPTERPKRRRAGLEQALFRRLDDLRKRTPEDLFELVERCLEVLHATQEALVQQRQEIRGLSATVAELQTRIDERSRRDELAPPAASERTAAPAREPERESSEREHVIMLSTPAGYRIVVEAGPVPIPGARLVHDGRSFEVLDARSSPFPGDARRAYFALPVAATGAQAPSADTGLEDQGVAGVTT